MKTTITQTPQPYYGTGRIHEPEVDLRLAYGDTRWELAIYIQQAPQGASEHYPTILNTAAGLVCARGCKPSIQNGDAKYGAHVPIILAIDGVIPQTLNDIIYHFHELHVAKGNSASQPTRFHKGFSTLRRALKEILIEVPPLQPTRIMAIRPSGRPDHPVQPNYKECMATRRTGTSKTHTPSYRNENKTSPGFPATRPQSIRA